MVPPRARRGSGDVRPGASRRWPARHAWSHAYAAYGEPKYPRGFTTSTTSTRMRQRAGRCKLAKPDRRTSFDKFNPFTIKGNSPAGATTLMFETLARAVGRRADDHVRTARRGHRWLRPTSRRSAFRLQPEGALQQRRSGHRRRRQVLVRHADEQGGGARSIARNSKASQAATVLDARTIRFDLKERTTDTIFNVGNLPVFSRKWGRGADGKPKTLRRNRQRISDHHAGRTRSRSADSGAAHRFRARSQTTGLATSGFARGQYNFDRVVYRYYQDNAIAMEAFKAGEFDFIMEYSARRWVAPARRAEVGRRPDHQGDVSKRFRRRASSRTSSTCAGRCSRIAACARRSILPTTSRRSTSTSSTSARNSLFANSDFAAHGPAQSPASSRLLEPFRAQLPPAVFGPAWVATAHRRRRPTRCATT